MTGIDEKLRQREARRKSDKKKQAEGYVRRSVWLPASCEADVRSFIETLCILHESGKQ